MNTPYAERQSKHGGNEASLDGGKTWPRLLPIVFTAEEAQKVFDGTKTQTRHLVKKGSIQFRTKEMPFAQTWPDDKWWDHRKLRPDLLEVAKFGRYRVGDILWVQEPWRTDEAHNKIKPTELPPFLRDEIAYEGDKKTRQDGKLRPGRFMPLRFSRPARYVVEAVRCERVNEIDEYDAREEIGGKPPVCTGDYPVAISIFSALWNSICTKPGTRFEDAPWVFAYTLRRIK